MITRAFAAQCILQLTEQSALEWFVDNEAGGYYTVTNNDWTIRLKGDQSFTHLTYQKGPKIEHITAGYRLHFFNNQDQELKMILQSLQRSVKEQIFKDKDSEKMSEEQEQRIRKEFCGSMLGWNK